MSIATRKLTQTNVPQIGPLDITQDPFYIVYQQDDAIYILVRVKYAPQTLQNRTCPMTDEYLLTPCYYGIGDEKSSYMLGVEQSGGSFQPPVVIDGVQLYVDSSGSIVSDEGLFTDVYAPTFTYQNGNLITTDTDGTQIYLVTVKTTIDANPAHIYFNTVSTTDPNQAGLYDLFTDQSYFLQNTYAGYNYNLTLEGIIPFRILPPYTQPASGFLLTPSYCASPASPKPFSYMCNSYTTLNPYNLLRYIQYTLMTGGGGGSSSHAIALWEYINDENPLLRQTAPNVANLFSFSFYLANANFATSAGTIQPLYTCTATASPGAFISEVFYFWASGFTSFSNSFSGAAQPIITQGNPGFAANGVANPINILGWTQNEECQRQFFYKYCYGLNYCGQCYGTCLAGTPCSEQPSYTQDNTPQGLNPFTCGTPIPSKNELLAFWEKYKWWIIIFGIIFVAIFILMIVVFAIQGKKNNEPEQKVIKYKNYEATDNLYSKYPSVY